MRWMFNSLFVTGVATFGVLFVSSLAAYAFARLEFPGRELLFMTMGATLLIPTTLLLIPTFMLIRTFGWIDTYHALIWPKFAAFFGVFLLRQFFMSIPRELEEAATIDGCSFFGIYWRIVLPLAKPALATLAIFTFLQVYNEFEWPLIVLNSTEMRTLPIGLAIFNGEYWNEQGIIMAGVVLNLRARAGGLSRVPKANHQGGHDGRVRGTLVTQESKQWSKEGAWAWYDAQPWLCGFNYIPATAINYTEMWQRDTYDPATIDAELDLAQDIGFNCVRVVLQYLVWEDDPEGTLKRMDDFMTRCFGRGMRVMWCFFDDCNFGTKDDPYLGQAGGRCARLLRQRLVAESGSQNGARPDWLGQARGLRHRGCEHVQRR